MPWKTFDQIIDIITILKNNFKKTILAFLEIKIDREIKAKVLYQILFKCVI